MSNSSSDKEYVLFKFNNGTTRFNSLHYFHFGIGRIEKNSSSKTSIFIHASTHTRTLNMFKSMRPELCSIIKDFRLCL